MYAIHTTPGFIIGSRPSGEAGKLLSVFTKDLGLIRASAQGIRFEKSKLRPFIQDHSLGLFSFVRGKEFWRLTNAQEIEVESLMSGSRERYPSGARRELIARVASLLNRLVQGEEAHPGLFSVLEHAFEYLEKSDLAGSDLLTLESLIVIRILHRLGYVPTVAGFELEIASDAIDSHMLDRLHDRRSELNLHINRALRESHL